MSIGGWVTSVPLNSVSAPPRRWGCTIDPSSWFTSNGPFGKNGDGVRTGPEQGHPVSHVRTSAAIITESAMMTRRFPEGVNADLSRPNGRQLEAGALAVAHGAYIPDPEGVRGRHEVRSSSAEERYVRDRTRAPPAARRGTGSIGTHLYRDPTPWRFRRPSLLTSLLAVGAPVRR